MDEQKEHYICKGECGGVAEVPGTCQAQTCHGFMQPLTACTCTDGTHQQDA